MWWSIRRINKLYLYGTINLTKSKVGSYASKTCWFLPCLSVSSHLVWGKRFVCVFCGCGPGYGVMVEGKMYLVKSIITRKWLCWAVPVFVTLSIIYSYKIRTAHTLKRFVTLPFTLCLIVCICNTNTIYCAKLLRYFNRNAFMKTRYISSKHWMCLLKYQMSALFRQTIVP